MPPRTHGMSRGDALQVKTYRAWVHMRERCLNPDHPGFANYGGRGITVCALWQDSFDSFVEHVGLPPTRFHSLDRIDNGKGYEPGNVRWATAETQRGNSRRTAMGNPRWKATPEKLARLRALLASGLSTRKAAEQVGLGKSLAAKELKRMRDE